MARHVFALQAKFRDGKLTPSEWEYYAGRLRMRARDYLRQGSRFDTDKGLPGLSNAASGPQYLAYSISRPKFRANCEQPRA